MATILRIDMGGAGGPAASLDPGAPYAGLAGRAMTSLLVAREVDPACHPLGGGNKLVLAPDRRRGPPRVAVGCKSPLTGGIAASVTDCAAADALLRLGYRALVIEGQPPGDDVWTVFVERERVSFAVENRHRMVGTLELAAELRRAHGAGAVLLTIGPAGEMGLGAASLTSPGAGDAAAHCGLGGAGAVLGSKRVKALVVEAGAAPPARADASDPGRAALHRDACGIRDPAVLAQLRALEDDLGLEPAEIAGAVALAMEAGLARFGDGQAALRLVAEIARWTPLGRIVGSGVRATADAFGLESSAALRRRGGTRPEPGRAELGGAARRVAAAEGAFLARARAATLADGPAAAGVRPHPIAFGAIDDDVARLFGAADPDADPFDPQLQLHVGLRSPTRRRLRTAQLARTGRAVPHGESKR